MTSSHDLHHQWQAAESAYRDERERYFPILSYTGRATELQPEPVTDEVLLGLGEFRERAEALHRNWSEALSEGR